MELAIATPYGKAKVADVDAATHLDNADDVAVVYHVEGLRTASHGIRG